VDAFHFAILVCLVKFLPKSIDLLQISFFLNFQALLECQLLGAFADAVGLHLRSGAFISHVFALLSLQGTSVKW